MGLTAFKKTDISREIFLFSILLYFAQGAFYPTGTIISQIALLTYNKHFYYFLHKSYTF